MKFGDLNLPHIETRPLAGGRVGYYWVPPRQARSLFTTSPLGEEINAQALEKYANKEKALERWRQEKVAEKTDGPKAGSVDWLIEDYEDSQWFKKNCEKTRTDYHNKLLALRNFILPNGQRFGEVPWAEITARHANRMFEWLLVGEDGERRPYATSIVIICRRVWKYAQGFEEKSFKRNPWLWVELKRPRSRNVRWLARQVEAFCLKAEEMGRLSVAIAAILCYELGQRGIDARKMTRAAFEGRRKIRVVQSKTDTELLLPISDILSEWLDKVPADQHDLVINEKTGRRYEDYELSKAVAEIRDAAKLPSYLWLMDLRRTCITELGESGASDDELVSVSGHQDRQMLNTYSLKSYKKAHAAMKARWANRANEKAPADEEAEDAA